MRESCRTVGKMYSLVLREIKDFADDDCEVLVFHMFCTLYLFQCCLFYNSRSPFTSLTMI
jgi:hypothetical protein